MSFPEKRLRSALRNKNKCEKHGTSLQPSLGSTLRVYPNQPFNRICVSQISYLKKSVQLKSYPEFPYFQPLTYYNRTQNDLPLFQIFTNAPFADVNESSLNDAYLRRRKNTKKRLNKQHAMTVQNAQTRTIRSPASNKTTERTNFPATQAHFRRCTNKKASLPLGCLPFRFQL